MSHEEDFPLFQKRPELIYFDNAATAQKPRAVLDAVKAFYEKTNSNIHRGPNFLSEEATLAYNGARQRVADFIHAKAPHEIIFTRNATESINLVARSYGDAFLSEGDEVVLSKMEHHSNIVPWIQLKERKGIVLRYFEVSDEGAFVFDPGLITPKCKLVALSGMSNVTGAIPDLPSIIQAAHEASAKVLIDACQSAVHNPTNVQTLDPDFLVFSGHKLYGPTGIGVLYGKEGLLKAMPPFLGGGDMIEEVTENHFTPGSLPAKFEAGTPNIAGAIGLAAAIDYLQSIGFDQIQSLEQELTAYLLKKLKALSFIRLIGPEGTEGRGSVVSFVMEGVHPHDVAEGLSQKNICIRGGHHCAQVLMDHLDLPGTARISLAFYNTKKEVDRAVSVLEEIYEYFRLG